MTSVLDHHRNVRLELSARDPAGQHYLRRLEALIGHSLADFVVSTAEHLAPFNCPDTVSFALPQLLLNALDPPRSKRLLLLAGSLVPLDNRQLPRGFMLPAEPPVPPFQLFSQRERKHSVVLKEAVRCNHTAPAVRAFLARFPWLRTDLCDPEPGCSFAAQLSYCMGTIADHWRLGPQACSLTVTPLEEVARAMLCELLDVGDPFCEQLLLVQAERQRIEQQLRGVFCAWGETHGSFLFWHAPGTGHILPLRQHGDQLVGKDYALPFERQALIDEIEARRLWPGVFLSLCMVSLLPGLPISGGPKQLRYYSRMVEAATPLLDAPRTTPLSSFGYMSCDPSTFRPHAGADTLAIRGTGLDLAERGIDPEQLGEQLAHTDVTPLSRFIPLRYD